MGVVEPGVEHGHLDPRPRQVGDKDLGGLQSPGSAGFVEARRCPGALRGLAAQQAVDESVHPVAIAVQIILVQVRDSG
jgi:hypothetical protein